MSAAVHVPSRSLRARVQRRAARYLARRVVTPQLTRGVVSFTFDDCPRSVLRNALPLLEREGWRATIYACVGLCDTVNHLGVHLSETELQEIHARGHEIADHSYSHLDAAAVGADAMRADIERNREAFVRLGLPRARSFAYPYGEVTPGVKSALAGEFELLRGIHDPKGAEVDLNLAASVRLYAHTVDAALGQIDMAARERRWLTLFSHDVRRQPSDFGCTPHDLTRVIDACLQNEVDVLTVSAALDRVMASEGACAA